MRPIAILILGLAIVASTEARASIMGIIPSDFAPGAQVITFEIGTTELPSVPGTNCAM